MQGQMINQVKPTFIIAEMGVNHNGDLALAKQLIDAASKAGADAVKTQSFHTNSVISKSAQKAEYQKQNDSKDESVFAMLKKLELSVAMYQELLEYAEQKGILLFSTPFDFASIQELKELGNPIAKIPSGEITNLPYLLHMAALNIPIIMSTGMSNLAEVRAAVQVLQGAGAKDITLLHCNTQYPTPMEDANVRAMLTLGEEFGLPVGYSDHTPGIDAAVAAVALGATVIEKHFTLDKNLPGPDHKASLEPDELIALVKAIRNVEKALGTGEKVVSSSERENITIARKSIVANIPIRKGEIITEDHLAVKRPGTGISPMRWFEVLGTQAVKDFTEDELITL